jgi:endonuclease/exonuclease/phosphatase family metal-dependent hydrolase
MDLSIGTFNLNNLFDRFNFEAEIGALPAKQRQVKSTYQWVLTGQGTAPGDPPPQLDPTDSTSPVFRIQRSVDGTLINPKSSEGQESLADRIDRMNCDVLCVQEVENIDALRLFNRTYLANSYQYEVLIEGNDPRFIDVGVLSRFPVANLTSHRFESHPDEPAVPVFGRDLLEVDILTPTRSRRLLTVFVNHLKSQFVRFDDPDPDSTRVANDRRRRRQAETVSRLVKARTRPNSRFVVLGDMNDVPESDTLEPMVVGMVDALANVVESRPAPSTRNPDDVPSSVKWTHRFPVSGASDRYSLFDQIWTSPALESKITHAEIERRPRWTASAKGVGSDHDPAWIRLSAL